MRGRKIAVISHDGIDKSMFALAHKDLTMQLRVPTHAASLDFNRYDTSSPFLSRSDITLF